MTDPLPSTSMVPMGAGVTSVELPSRFTVTKGPGTYELSWRWRDQVPLRNFVGVWGLFACMPLVTLVRGWPTATVVLGAVCAWITVWIALAWAKNRVTLRLEHGVVTVIHGPVPSLHARPAVLEPADVVTAFRAPGRSPRWAVVVRGARSQWLLVGPLLSEAQAHRVADELNVARAALGFP